ncbi:MAG: FAD-dependent thymidylate synthase [Euryarchaeota archaeon]|nr:FAD-dependent thymidylate synthase [Euryarchaeota archaeon]
MDIEIKNLKVFNGVEFVARSARVSGVGKVRCDCEGGCERCSGTGLREPTDEEIFEMIVENDYSSALEHVVFSFEIHGLSKGNALELLEHRIASHTGRSTRYQSELGFGYCLAPEVERVLRRNRIPESTYREYVEGRGALPELPERDRKVLESYAGAMRCAREAYARLLELGAGRESARYTLPFALHTAYTYTINLRSLINFLGLRLCVRASPEMRELAAKLYIAVREKFPWISLVWCRGYNQGACPENEVRDSPQGRECPFKNPESSVFIPTKKQVRSGIELRPFSRQEFERVRERLLERWAQSSGSG